MREVCKTQKTPEWYAARRGKPTASAVWKIMATKRNGEPTAEYEKYKKQLALEIVNACTAEHFVSQAMDKGTEYEPEARQAYCDDILIPKGLSWRQTGFVLHPAMDRLGCSPDLLVGNNGGADFKCPLSSTHWDYLDAYAFAKRRKLSGFEFEQAVVPEKYMYQNQTCIACCERDEWDWVSWAIDDPAYGYYPFPPSLRRVVVKVHRNDKMIAEIEDKVKRFNEELEKYVREIVAAF